jgi:hypothetical protein
MRKKSKSNQAIWIQMNLPQSHRDKKRGGDKGRGRQGEEEFNSNRLVSAFPLLPVSLSPCPPVSLSSSHGLCGMGKKIRPED